MNIIKKKISDLRKCLLIFNQLKYSEIPGKLFLPEAGHCLFADLLNKKATFLSYTFLMHVTHMPS